LVIWLAPNQCSFHFPAAVGTDCCVARAIGCDRTRI
jgi:hypothetical protein